MAYPRIAVSFSVAVPETRVLVEQRLDFSLALVMILPSGPMMEVSKKLFLHFSACQYDLDSLLLLW